MTDSIPQQAGPGAGADERAQFEAAMTRLESYSGTDFDRDSKGQYEFRSLRAYWFGWQARAHFSHLAAPLAVEDSRERCALTDESIDTLLASVGPTQGMRPDSRDLTLAQVRKLVRAAMAAASSGKEN